MTKRKLAVMVLAGGGLLASCSGDDNVSVSDVALHQIPTKTCTSNTPQEITYINFSNDETQVDVSNLTPGCTLSGG